jgi:class 3 adenylate cyclase/tetratricopeptide (TPR) repeat protein
MKCPKCQFANPEGAKFCNECGHNLTPTLEATSQAFSFTDKLAKIERYLPEGLTEKILAQKDKIEGERRQVTVMFCDMEGFTPLVEKLGPEEAFSLMDHVYELLIHNVSDYEGTINELTGDGIMALFGAPIALEDAPQRALWSALSIHNAIAKFNEQKKGIMPVKMRIGVHTGPVVVGTLGNDLRVQFTAVGNTVNLASRMEGLAKPGSTFVTEATYKLTKSFFRFEAIGKKTVKGKKEAIPVYKVLSGREDMYGLRLGSARMIYSKMVGRDRAIDRLELQVMKAINGQGSIVNIIGEAGIGKSRLVAELKKREVIKRVTIFEGRAISMGRNLSFHPIIDLLKQWALIKEDDGEATALGNLEMAVRNVCPEDLYEVLPFLATLMGMKLFGRYAERVKGLEGEALDNLILKSFRELLIKATELTPLVIVLEDMHWADNSSVELMKSLFRMAETQKILFVNVFRPGHEETGDRIAETVREKFEVYYVEIALEPLDSRMSEALITNMLKIGELHHAFIRRIVDRAGGNPFFIEEVVRSLIDEGAIVLKDGTFTVTEKISTVAIPNTINDVLMARIDRLEEKTRDLVKVASVIGRNFFYRLLQEVADAVEDIDDRLSYLKEIQLIRERKRMGELEYLFKHTLAQEVAYESILPLKRKKLHLKVARSIEKVFGDRLHEFYGMLAYHYSRAESLDKTEEYLIKAGEEALKSSASSVALHYFQEALTLYLKKYDEIVDPEKVAMIEKNIALAFYNRGQYVEAIEYFDKALNYYWKKLPKHQISTVYQFLSGFFHFLISLYLPFLKFRRIPTQRDEEAVDLFFKKLKALPIIDPKRFFLESFPYYKGITKFDLTKFDLGIGLFVSASNLFSFTGISFRLSRKILGLFKDEVDRNDVKSYTVYDFSETLHNYFEGNWKEIKEYDDGLVSENLSIGELYWASQHLFWHACPKLFQGYLDIPKLMVNKLDDLFDVYENDLSMVLKYLLNTSLLMERRKLHEALIEIEKGIEFGQKISMSTILVEMYSRKAHIHVLMGDIDDAKISLDLADKVRREIDTVPWQLTDFFRGQFGYDLYQLKESIRKGSKSGISLYRKKAKKSGKRLLKVTQKVAQYRVDSYRLRGAYYWLINRQKKALKWWQRAIEEGEHLGARIELSRTYSEIGKCLLETESKYKMLNTIKAEEYLEKARALFEEMDLQWDLDELDRVTRG